MTSDEINKKILRLINKGDSEFQTLLKDYEKNLLKIYGLALKEIKSKLAAIFQKFGDDVQYADLVSFNRLKNLEASISAEIKKVTNKSIASIQTQLKEFYSESYLRTAYSVESGLGIKLVFGTVNERVIEAALKNPLDRISWPERMKDHAQHYIKQIRQELTRGLIQGEGYGKIADKIEEATKINFSKVIRIVRTEGHRVQNTARILSLDKTKAAAERLGIKSERYWIHSGNPREPRPDHIEMNGVAADEEGIFTLPDGTTTEGPGLSGVAEHDINCGCTTGMRFKGLESISFNEYNPGSYENFKEQLIS